VIEIVTIETPSLGDRTYLATDGVSALVIDPQRTSPGSSRWRAREAGTPSPRSMTTSGVPPTRACLSPDLQRTRTPRSPDRRRWRLPT
jgi:hypothetical protein